MFVHAHHSDLDTLSRQSDFSFTRENHVSFHRSGSNCRLTFQPTLTYTPRVDGFVIALVVADLNKDGDFDFVVVDKGSNNIDTQVTRR